MAPPQKQMRPGRQLAVLGMLFVILGTWAWFGGSGGWQERLEPRLGLDLVGGTRVTLKAQTKDGNPPSATDMEQARQIIQARVDARGVAEAEVVTEGNENIVISVTGRGEDAIKDIGQAAQMFFRKVLKTTNGAGVTLPEPTPSASGTPDPTATPDPDATPDPSASADPSASPDTSGTGGGTAVDPSATPDPSESPEAPADNNRRVTPEEVKAKVGEAAWTAAEALAEPAADVAQVTLLEPFASLDEFEVNALTPQMQFNIPQISCEMLNKRPAGSISDPAEPAVACGVDQDLGTKMLLDVSKVAGTNIDQASPNVRQNTGERVVSLDFKDDTWTELSREAFNNDGETKCDATALGDEGKCRVAVVLDNTVISAPQIQEVLPRSGSEITGSFTAQQAKELADYLNYGSLAVSFEQTESQTVTATLGKEYLKAGLLAAGIGLLLVILYSFFYYRLLGSVIFLSLILSAGLIFLALVIMGRQIGFTLTLAGIAGFIVSLGVAADSFVIYFERLKDEIREGRTPRSAVPRAWARARRTILTANAISVMAAVVLYLFSAGAVRGFAFALGMATVLDLVVVFLFRHPIMALFARTGAFLSPRVSGLGRVLREAKEAN